MEELKKYNTPQITNITCCYPHLKTNLGLYNPWQCNWYTNTSMKTMFPELGRTVGYAVTCVFGQKDPNFGRITCPDVFDEIEKSPKPCVLVIKLEFPDHMRSKVGLLGGNMATHMSTLGCVGVI